jgi:hypothetical protein
MFFTLDAISRDSMTHKFILIFVLSLYVFVIFLYSGTELYRERVVRALAQDLQVPLLVLDSSILAPYVSSGRNLKSFNGFLL